MITSFQNPLVKRIRKLRRKKYRQEEGAFFVEGIRVVLTALERGAAVESLVYAPDLLTSEVAWAALSEKQELGIRTVSVSREIFQNLSERDNPVGLGAIVAARLRPLAKLDVADTDIFVAVEDVGDPGNLGTIVRTADGVGAAGLLMVGQTTDPFHPTAVKASMGAIFSVTLSEIPAMDDLWGWAREKGLHTIATSAGASRSYWEAGYRFPALLLLGSEGEGLAPEVLERAEMAVRIPMYGVSSSLNLSVAAGLLLYELRRALRF